MPDSCSTVLCFSGSLARDTHIEVLFLQQLMCTTDVLCTKTHFLKSSPSLAQQPNAGQGRRVLEVSRSHTVTHHSRWDSSRQVIGPSQRPLPDNTQHSQETYIHAPGWIYLLCSFFFLLVCTFIHFVPLYPSYSCHLFLYNTQHKHQCPRRDANPQSQQAVGRRPSPQTARLLGSAV